MTVPTQLPPSLDCHAHIAPDVTAAQLASLGEAHVFAMTRSLDEAATVVTRHDPALTWGLGVHPGLPAARAAYDPERFRSLLPRFALVGEVGWIDAQGATNRHAYSPTSSAPAGPTGPHLGALHRPSRRGR